MIELTRLNKHKLFVNCDLLKYAEALPDTVLTLVTGEKLVVLETCEQVTALTTRFRAGLLEAAWPDATATLSALLSCAALKAAPKDSE